MKPLAKTELEPTRQQDGDFLNIAIKRLQISNSLL
jgi:hypothetical protein